MHITAEHHLAGLTERRFHLGGTPGILWSPRSATPAQPVPVVLAGQPGGPAGIDQTYPLMLARARHAGDHGMAMVTIELPGSGAQPPAPGVTEARAALRQQIAAHRPVSDEIVDRLILPLVEEAVPAWQATLDAVLELPEIDGPVGYSGGVISIGAQLALVEPRIAAAVLFAGSYVPRSILMQAPRITIPLYVLLQWDDEGNDRAMALNLFDAFGSQEKTLNANMGGHTGVPQHAGDDANRFMVRHLIAPR